MIKKDQLDVFYLTDLFLVELTGKLEVYLEYD